MGISVRVVVEPKCISKQAWRCVYAETATILRAWPDPPMRCAYRTVAGVKVIQRTREVIDADGWSVCGDARSRRFAESNELPSELGVEQPSEPDSELVLRYLDGDRSAHYLLGNKTQGLPFHILIVAVAMLIEHRFPRAAVVTADAEQLLRAMADGARKVGVYLTEMAWDEIERASMEELRFLAALAWMSPFNLGIELKPAAFESAAIRRYCLAARSRPRQFVDVR